MAVKVHRIYPVEGGIAETVIAWNQPLQIRPLRCNGRGMDNKPVNAFIISVVREGFIPIVDDIVRAEEGLPVQMDIDAGRRRSPRTADCAGFTLSSPIDRIRPPDI